MTSGEAAAAGGRDYDGFISYSHAADGLLAPRLQAGLQRFAKPWWKRRALRMFRDETSLSANPQLWSSITGALDSSEWFVLLLSPDAAASPWVNQEIEYWKTHKDPSRILPVLTDGSFSWVDGDVTGSAVPEELVGVFSEEPRWVDLRFAKDEEQLDLKDPRFADAVADIASALRGIPKDELASEEVKQHRRTVRTAWGAAALVGLLAVAATVLAFQSAKNARLAEAEATRANQEADRAEGEARRAEANAQLARARELGAAASESLDADPRLARILALEAIAVGGADDPPSTVVNALWQSLLRDRLIKEITFDLPGNTPIGISRDGSFLVLTSDDARTAVGFSLPNGDEKWRIERPAARAIGSSAPSPDGSLVAIGVWEADESGDPPARIEILESAAGSEITRIVYRDCSRVEPWSWSVDGTRLAINNGFEPCPRKGAEGGIWVEVLDTATWESVALVPVDDPSVGVPRFDDDGRLYVFGLETSTSIYRADDYSLIAEIDPAIGIGAVSPDGSLLAIFSQATGAPLQLIDAATGVVRDNLAPMDGQPVSNGFEFSADSSQLAVGTISNQTYIWDTSSGRLIHSLPSGVAISALMSPDGMTLYTSHGGGVVRFWDLGPQTANTSSTGDLGDYTWVNANAFAIGETIGGFVALDLDGDCFPFCGQARFFDLVTGELLEHVVEQGGNVFALPDGRFAVQDFDFRVFLVDPGSGQSELFVDCDRDDEGNCLGSLGTTGQLVVRVVTSVDGDEVGLVRLVSFPEARLEVIDPATGEVLEETPVNGDVKAFSREWVLTDNFEGEFVVVERGTGTELHRGDLAVGRWETSPTGQRAASVTFELDLVLMDFGTWDLTRYELETGRIRGMGFAPGDRQIALGDEEALYIFDFGEGLITQTIPIPGVSDIHWIDEETIVIGTNDGLWATVSLVLEDLITAARNPRVPREFTVQECATYRIDPCPTLEQMKSG